MKKIKAFTLAEVLIVIGIIGIITEFTIPTLINNIHDQENKVAYKKAYSILSQAFLEAANNDELYEYSSWYDGDTKTKNFNAIKSHFKVVKDCNQNNNSECWNSNGEKFWGNPSNESTFAFVDASGMAWSLSSNDASAGNEIFVDTNGNKKPNKDGQDRFTFNMLCNNENWYTGEGLNCIASKVVIRPDCTTTDSSDCPGSQYQSVCPSVATHPCYFTSWIIGKS